MTGWPSPGGKSTSKRLAGNRVDASVSVRGASSKVSSQFGASAVFAKIDSPRMLQCNYTRLGCKRSASCSRSSTSSSPSLSGGLIAFSDAGRLSVIRAIGPSCSYRTGCSVELDMSDFEPLKR